MPETKGKIQRLLVVVDESSATKRALEYVGNLVGGRRGFGIVLLQLLQPMPPELLEFGGAERPKKEEKLGAELRRDQQTWIDSARNSAESNLDSAAEHLRRAGVFRRDIETSLSDPMMGRDAADTVLEHARTKRCHTVVIGHGAHSWFRELAGGDLAEHLIRQGKGVAMWVVQ